uniref:Dolichol-phosphate mannosyltransferase subunit 3 n=1 Tax=Globodera rostochiensis TaxID=31243 RepID=A0A914HKL4_GLORO
MAIQLVIFAWRLSPFFIAWLSLFFAIGPLEHLVAGDEHRRHVLLLLLPLAMLAGLGVYAVGSVLYGVFTFNDCATARKRLISEVNEAKQDLFRRGLIQKVDGSQMQRNKDE